MLSEHTRSIHWSLADPAQAQGTDKQKLVVFRQVRDEIKEYVSKLG